MPRFGYIHIVIALVTSLFVSCEQKPYEAGDSELSYLCAEMADMHVVGRNVESIITDNDEKLQLPDGVTVSESMAREDSVYRVFLYYNKVVGKPVELFNYKNVAVAIPIKNTSGKKVLTDPVSTVAAWKSNNGKYVNFRLGLKSGSNTLSLHRLAFVVSDVIVGQDGHKRYDIQLYHDQNGVPEYYTQDAYLSIPLTDGYEVGDVLSVSVNTYDGIQNFVFCKIE